MERAQRFGQEPSFRVDPEPVGYPIIASNGRVINSGESRRRSEPIPGTSNRRNRNSGQRRR